MSPAAPTGPRELGVLGEEAVPGVDGVGAGGASGREQVVARQVGRPQVGGPMRTADVASATNGASRSGSA
jgi:hypothetical protein